ncbi:hypothetical protein ABW11_20990 [Pluralibacter gergoviae]|uniref:hypothetical protein n=1 Tax=Pluralibacter gergoviae TaxID=61647 RepID=UPI00065045DC|nr:hypothetical protein [Pluralibacter gergoviae]KMK23089.1 hypothetical protein ABW11_20990 [Pluralibacter gergoviae]
MKTRSLYLNPDTWDIELNSSNNLSTVGNPYACAQDVATACSAFRGECIYQTGIGVPYNEKILGQNPGTGSVQTWLENEALRLPYIADARATIVAGEARVATGVIVITDRNGTESTLNL